MRTAITFERMSFTGEKGIVVLTSDIINNSTVFGFDVAFDDRTLGGAIVFETARQDFGGKWAVLGEVVWKEANHSQHVTITEKISALRIRPSQPILGGACLVTGSAI